jgi:ABC-type phosphate transport system substrate-binding protein
MIKVSKQMHWLLGLMMAGFLHLSSGYAAELAVIVGADVKADQLTSHQVQRIFLRKTRLSPQGEAWVPVNLNAHQHLRKILNQTILQKNHVDLERYWNEQYFNGVTPPYVLASEEAVIRFVSETPYAIGYILSCHIDARVKTVYTLSLKRADGLSCH